MNSLNMPDLRTELYFMTMINRKALEGAPIAYIQYLVTKFLKDTFPCSLGPGYHGDGQPQGWMVQPTGISDRKDNHHTRTVLITGTQTKLAPACAWLGRPSFRTPGDRGLDLEFQPLRISSKCTLYVIVNECIQSR